MKRLTLTYGVAPGRQRTISIPVHRLNLVLGLFAATTVWTALSLVYMLWRGLAPGAVGPLPATDLDAAATGAFAGDGGGMVEETTHAKDLGLVAAPLVATPPAKADAAPAAVAAAAPDAATTASAAAPPETTGLVSTAPVNVIDDPVDDAVDGEDAAAPLAAATLAEQRLPAALTGVHFASAAGHLQARFVLENRGPATLAGDIAGEATFRRVDGTDAVVPAKATFKARLRTVKALTFTAPDATGTFTGVRLVVTDTAKRRALVQAFDSVAE